MKTNPTAPLHLILAAILCAGALLLNGCANLSADLSKAGADTKSALDKAATQVGSAAKEVIAIAPAVVSVATTVAADTVVIVGNGAPTPAPATGPTATVSTVLISPSP